MTFHSDTALAALGLPEGDAVDPLAVAKAFERLAKRYPPTHFPDKFKKILEARDFLLNQGRAWREFVSTKTLDLSWAAPCLSKNTVAPLPLEDERMHLQNLLRATFKSDPLFDFDDETPFDDDVPDTFEREMLERMLSEVMGNKGGGGRSAKTRM